MRVYSHWMVSLWFITPFIPSTYNIIWPKAIEENKKQGDIMVLHVNIIFNHHNASWDFLILSTQYVKNQNWREFLGSEIIKISFQRKSVDHSRRNKGYSGHLEDAIKAPNQWLLFLCALMYKYMFLCFYICV